MPSSRQRLGGLAEDQAVLFLRAKGYAIIGRHLTSRYGEIDILARDGETRVIVEVKARRSARFGTAIESVTPRKLSRLMNAYEDWRVQTGAPNANVRVDVITLDQGRVRHLVGVDVEP